MLDFGNEGEQRESNYGPVPTGSIVYVRLKIMDDAISQSVPNLPCARRAQSGLVQLPCQFAVSGGQYDGVWWFQNITLPRGMQTVPLTAGQERAANIGGAQLKAILAAAGHSSRVNSLKDFDGLNVPVKVRLNNKPHIDDQGREWWRNEIARVITPEMEEFAQVRQSGEIINKDGAIEGKPQAPAPTRQPPAGTVSNAYYGRLPETAPDTDDVPF